MTVDAGGRGSSDETKPGEGPIFVVGSMRSGSTMLRLILDSHPHVAIGAETGFMGGLLAAKSIPNWRYGTDWYHRLDWTESEVDGLLRDFYGAMFGRYAAAQGKRRWGEKTPFHTSHMAAMAQVFPDAVFVGIVRHPGAVAASLRKSFHYTFPDALSYWSATYLDMVRSATSLGSRFVVCRYEDLVVSGEPVLRELMTFLAEPWSDGLLQHHRVQQQKGAPRVADGSTISSDPIDAKRVESWTSTATAEDYEALAATADLAAFFGYDPVDALSREALLPAGGDRTWLPTGLDLRLRRQEWAERIDFEQRPPTLAIDAKPEDLAQRLAQVERALARTRSRKSVRLSEALRKIQHGRSLRDVRELWSVVRSSSR